MFRALAPLWFNPTHIGTRRFRNDRERLTNPLGKIPRLIGLISDTHGLLRPEAMRVLRGSDLIIHAGDVGKREVLLELNALAPVVAVRGNVDTASWARDLPTTTVAEAGDVNIFVLHDLDQLDLKPEAAGFQVVVSGHSHKPARANREGVLYINPGSAGPKRFQLPVSVARLDLGTEPWGLEFVDLESTDKATRTR